LWPKQWGTKDPNLLRRGRLTTKGKKVKTPFVQNKKGILRKTLGGSMALRGDDSETRGRGGAGVENREWGGSCNKVDHFFSKENNCFRKNKRPNKLLTIRLVIRAQEKGAYPSPLVHENPERQACGVRKRPFP